MSEYGYSVEVPDGYDEAVIRTRVAMRSEGFSILSEMHVGGALGDLTGPGRQYLILGVYNPAVSTRSIAGDLRVAVHLPCNFVVQDDPPSAVVAALDPEDSADTTQIPPELIADARQALTRALQRIGEPS